VTGPDTARANRGFVLRRYPAAIPQADDFELRALPWREPGEQEVLVEVAYLSMDPAARMRMSPAARSPIRVGEVVGGRGVGTVLQSRHAELQAGDAVAGELGWQEYATLPGAALRKIDPAHKPLQAALGILGPPGITAWCLVERAARVRSGETVAITAAVGSVGSVAAQWAALAGARVIALVAGERQAQFAREQLQPAAVIDCRSAHFEEQLATAAGAGLEVVLDSVGGSVHNALMGRIAEHARIVVFGFISSYNESAPAEYGRMYQVIHRRAHLQGFLVGDYAPHFGAALDGLAAALRAGKLRNFEHISEGLERAPASFAALFSAEPLGKQLVHVPH
jgi:NADPH-dependent curcumin reductase CurA